MIIAYKDLRLAGAGFGLIIPDNNPTGSIKLRNPRKSNRFAPEGASLAETRQPDRPAAPIGLVAGEAPRLYGNVGEIGRVAVGAAVGVAGSSSCRFFRSRMKGLPVLDGSKIKPTLGASF